MAQQVLQINFQFNVSVAEYEKAAWTVADHFTNFPGLRWKIWLKNENKKEAGGIYLFESAEAAEAYRNSKLFKGLESNPVFTNISVKQFEIIPQLSQLTHAPLDPSVVASS